jgi:hypothetical protein
VALHLDPAGAARSGQACATGKPASRTRSQISRVLQEPGRWTAGAIMGLVIIDPVEVIRYVGRDTRDAEPPSR